MRTRASIVSLAVGGIAAALAVALVILMFRAYQDPSVALPVLANFSLCG